MRSQRDLHFRIGERLASGCSEGKVDDMQCISNNSAYIRKKAILTSIKIIKRVPEYISEFLPKISTCLEEKSHGVLLSCLAFL